MSDVAYNPNVCVANTCIGSEPKAEKPSIRKAINILLEALSNVELRSLGIERAIFGDNEKDSLAVDPGLNNELCFIYQKLRTIEDRLARIERYVG